MGVGKNNNQKIATMLYIVMFGMGKDQHIIMHILENKYCGNVIFKGGLNFFSKKQTQRSQDNIYDRRD